MSLEAIPVQHPTAPTEHSMAAHKPWYFTHQQWTDKLAQDARWAAAVPGEAATPPTVRIPAGVPADIWERMTPAEQAKLYADQANTQAVVRASQSTKNALWLIFVVIPIVILIIVFMVNSTH
jgi:hypothetical protein